jgi:biopolymer transport protein ExbB
VLAAETTLFQILLKGGPMMWLILLCSVIALAIAVERGSYYLTSSQDVNKFRKDLFDALKRGDREGAFQLCSTARSLAGRIFRAGIMQFGDSREEIAHAMEREAHIQVPALEKWLPALALIANISPLFGFLGTALGLASSFFWVQSNAAPLNPVSLNFFTGGIWQALLTTIAGLCVGIFAAVAYHVYVIWVNSTVLTLEREAEEFADQISYLSGTAFDKDKDNGLPEEL